MIAVSESLTGLESVCLRLPHADLKKQSRKQSPQAARARRVLVTWEGLWLSKV